MRAITQVLILLTCAGVMGCTGQLPPTYPPPPTNFGLTPGDKLGISVFNQPQLSGEFTVTENGTLALPLIGEITALELSMDELSSAIIDRLRPDYLKDPKVTVTLLSNRPIYLLGEVNRPGSYEYVEALSVAKAIALAGGFTYRASQRKILITRRTTDGQMREFRADKATQVRGGDLITVAERYF